MCVGKSCHEACHALDLFGVSEALLCRHILFFIYIMTQSRFPNLFYSWEMWLMWSCFIRIQVYSSDFKFGTSHLPVCLYLSINNFNFDFIPSQSVWGCSVVPLLLNERRPNIFPKFLLPLPDVVLSLRSLSVWPITAPRRHHCNSL